MSTPPLRIKQAVVGFGRAEKPGQSMGKDCWRSIVRLPAMQRLHWLAQVARSSAPCDGVAAEVPVVQRSRSQANGRRAWTARVQGFE